MWEDWREMTASGVPPLRVSHQQTFNIGFSLSFQISRGQDFEKIVFFSRTSFFAAMAEKNLPVLRMVSSFQGVQKCDKEANLSIIAASRK